MPAIQEQIEKLRKKIESYRALRDDLGEEAERKITELEKELQALVDTQGGAFVGGNVNTQGGDFVGRDKIEAILNSRVFKVSGDANGNIVILGDNNTLTLTPDEAPQVLLRAYYRALARECQRLPLGMLGPEFAVPGAEQKISLRSVYTDLDVTAPPRPEGDDPKELHAWGLRMSKGEGGQRAPLLQAISEPDIRKLVLLGEAGSGKTTFVNYISAVLAEPGEGDELPETLRGLLPARLLLRETARSIPVDIEQGQAGFLWQALQVEIGETLGETGAEKLLPYLQSQISRHGALILLDGLDEVPETDHRRQCLLDSVQHWVETLPENTRFLLTARPYAYSLDRQLALPDFQVISLAPFSSEQAASFIEQWYRAVQPTQGWDAETAGEKASELSQALENRPQLADLAARPLLLTLMATLHTHRGKLPEDRADLYEGSVSLLLERWQTQRQLKGVTEPGIERVLGLGETKLRRAVELLAYETHERQGGDPALRDGDLGTQAADIPFEQVSSVFSRQLPHDINPILLVKYLEERSGLLIGRRAGVYAFLHRSFQEYLAGCYLANTEQDVARTLKDKVTHDLNWWREVYLLAVGKVKQGSYSSAVNILNRLVPDLPARNASDLEYRLAILATQSAQELRLPENAENDDFYRTLLKRLQAWLLRLVEVGKLSTSERFEAANLLARLGDPRFDEKRLCLPALLRGQPEPMLGFVKIPAGEFTMGSPEDDEQAYDDEKPAHAVNLPEYYIARYPVTNAQYRYFVADKGYEKDQYWTPEGLAWRDGAEPDFSAFDVVTDEEQKKSVENYKQWVLGRQNRNLPYWYGDPTWGAPTRPVVGISWYEALAYCNWLTEQLAGISEQLAVKQQAQGFWAGLREGRLRVGLPSEAQWEKAARGPLLPAREKGGGMRVYPWGDTWKNDRANTDETELKQTSPVGLFPKGKSPAGLLDLSGNVWEWTRSRWGSASIFKPDYGYPYLPGEERDDLSGSALRVLRGGSWLFFRRLARCAGRGRFVPDNFNDLIGFRCIVSLAISPS